MLTVQTHNPNLVRICSDARGQIGSGWVFADGKTEKALIATSMEFDKYEDLYVDHPVFREDGSIYFQRLTVLQRHKDLDILYLETNLVPLVENPNHGWAGFPEISDTSHFGLNMYCSLQATPQDQDTQFYFGLNGNHSPKLNKNGSLTFYAPFMYVPRPHYPLILGCAVSSNNTTCGIVTRYGPMKVDPNDVSRPVMVYHATFLNTSLAFNYYMF
jgi:hypothetical protein